MLRLSSSARLAIIVSTNSLLSCKVSRFSFSKYNLDSQLFELADALNAVQCVSCESADRFGDYYIHLALQTIVHQPLEILTLYAFSAQAGVRIDIYEFPIVMTFYQLLKVFDLRLVTAFLFFVVGGHPCIRRYAQFCRFAVCADSPRHFLSGLRWYQPYFRLCVCTVFHLRFLPSRWYMISLF